MAPIRKGDGTVVDPTGFSEVRTGDGTVLYSAIPDSVASRPNDDSEFTNTDAKNGLAVLLNDDWLSIGAEISDNTIGATRAYLSDVDNGSIGSLIDDVDISQLSAGDAFTFDDVGLTSGNEYAISLNAEGEPFDTGNAAGESNYPYSSGGAVEIVACVADSEYRTDIEVQAVNNIGDVGF